MTASNRKQRQAGLSLESAASLRDHQQECRSRRWPPRLSLRRWNAAVAATLITTSPVALPAFAAVLLVGLLPTSASAQTKLDNPVLTLEPTASGELTAIWNDVSGADSYNLLYRTKGTETWFVSNANVNRIFPATSPQVITGLTNGTTYEVRVIANPGPGISPSLSGASGTVEGTPNPPPTSISDLQLTPKDGSIEVSWTAATVAPNGYSVRWRKRSPAPAEPNLTPIKEVGGTSFTIPDLTNGSLYLVVVHTLNRADDGIERSTRVDGTARPRANTAPTVANAIPDQTATAASDFSYAFPPNTFSDADGHPLTYTASRADDMALPTWLTFTASERTFSGIPGATEIGTTISVKVTASDTEGGSVSDEFDITVTKGTLATPTGLAVKSDTLSQVGFTVTWTAVPNAAGYTATATPSGGSAIDGTVFTTGTKPQASFTGLSASMCLHGLGHGHRQRQLQQQRARDAESDHIGGCAHPGE